MSKTSIEWRQERAAKITEARKLVDLADGENRDFTAEERTAYDALMGEGGAIGKLTGTIQERERLEELERDLGEPTREAIKPEGKNADKTKVLKRAEFDAMEPEARMKFSKGGGTLED
jgi:hypothetical protein